MFRSKLSLGGIVLIGALMLGGGAVRSASEDDVANSANYIMLGCREFLITDSNKQAFGQAFCLGLITGLAYMIDDPCIPFASVPRSQLVRVVVQYIDSRPARLHEPFSKLAVEAIKAAWPCKP
jgi:Rap1a immunity proteins